MSDLDQQALKAAEEFVLSRYVDLTRNALLRSWFGDLKPEYLEEQAREDEDFQAMQFADGHLVCGIQTSRVLGCDDAVWHVGITPYSGSYTMAEEFWRVYRADNGEWIVEGE